MSGELKRALPELAYRGELNHFLKSGKGVDENPHVIETKKNDGSDQNTKVITIIIWGIDGKELSDGYRKAHIQQLGQIITANDLKLAMGPAMDFGLEDMCPIQALYNDALVIQLKITMPMVCRILVVIGSPVDIIILKCLKKLQYSEKDLQSRRHL